MREVVEEVAKTDVPLLIRGETGTGKELVAQAVHIKSNRHSKPLVKVNCAAIPQGLVESELFGHERGAFTGAQLNKPGKFELAHGGTILLSEIGDLGQSVQAKLLQVLQDGEFFHLGGGGTISVDTRVITTTKDNLERAIIENRFRQDLFYRINVVSITLPPLRERREQIIPLSQYFFNLYKAKYGKMSTGLSFRVLSAFKDYDWPGNIRELENVVKSVVLLGDEETVFQELVKKRPESQKEMPKGSDSPGLVRSGGRYSLNLRETGKKAAETAETKMILDVLRKTRWNRKEAARLLQVSYKALLNKIRKYELRKPIEVPRIGGVEGWKSQRREREKQQKWGWAES